MLILCYELHYFLKFNFCCGVGIIYFVFFIILFYLRGVFGGLGWKSHSVSGSSGINQNNKMKNKLNAHQTQNALHVQPIIYPIHLTRCTSEVTRRHSELT